MIINYKVINTTDHIPKFGHMAKWDSPNIAILMMVALQPPHFSIAVYSPGIPCGKLPLLSNS